MLLTAYISTYVIKISAVRYGILIKSTNLPGLVDSLKFTK